MDYIILLLPLVLIELGFRIYTIIDIYKVDRKVKGGNKLVWALVSGLINFGWVIYLIVGKEE